jgi:hypothetical protein
MRRILRNSCNTFDNRLFNGIGRKGAHILVPEAELEKLVKPATFEIAEYFGIPEQLATLRLEQIFTENERERWQQI